MRKITCFTTAVAGALVLAACGSSDDASTEAQAETVEMPADEALFDVEEEPVADAEIAAEVSGPEPVSEEDATAAADAAADVAAAAEAAAAAADIEE